MAAITDLATASSVVAGDLFVVNQSGVDRKVDAGLFAQKVSGTWTPTLTFGGASTGITYAARWGLYYRVGDICFIEGGFTLSSKGSATGLPVVTGLPVTCRNLAGAYVPLTVDWINMTTALVQMSATMLVNTSTFALGGVGGAATTVAGLAAGDFANNTELRFAGCYIA